MVNTYNKGVRVQRKAVEFLYKELKADLVFSIHHSRWQKDIFNLWDGFFVKHNRVHFFQCKCSKPNLKPFKEFYDNYEIPFVILIYKDRVGFKVINNLAFNSIENAPIENLMDAENNVPTAL